MTYKREHIDRGELLRALKDNPNSFILIELLRLVDTQKGTE